MKIYYVKKNKLLNKISMGELEIYSDGRKYFSKDKYLEHLCGLYLVELVGKKFYNVKNSEILIQNNKPCFSSGEINFSISHSGNIILAAFSSENIGVDIEYMKLRDYLPILKRYNSDIKNPSKEDFYKFWTEYEAKIKLGADVKGIFSKIIEGDYMLTCVSDKTLTSDIEIVELQ